MRQFGALPVDNPVNAKRTFEGEESGAPELLKDNYQFEDVSAMIA